MRFGTFGIIENGFETGQGKRAGRKFSFMLL